MDEIKDVSASSANYVIPAEFQPLVERAKAALQPIDAPMDPGTFTQAIVVMTKEGQLCSSAVADWFTSPKDEEELCPEERALIEALWAAGSPVERLLCMWKSEEEGRSVLPLEHPSAHFRLALCQLHRENKNAKLLLVGSENYLTKTVFEGLPSQWQERFSEE